MASNISLSATIQANTQALENKIRDIERRGLNLSLKSGKSLPLGQISKDAAEFDKSIQAATARVQAFGLAAGSIYVVSRALREMLDNAISVEKQLSSINVILNASSIQLKGFANNLFEIAKLTGQSFDSVAQAATEFSRQSLTMPEALRRTKDAMILTRFANMDAAESVKTLTAAINSFSRESLTSSEIVNRMVGLDVSFAVTVRDLSESLARAGATAQDVNVSFNEMIALTTAVQQTTARGGAVIGNAFKSIFTRLERSSTIEQLKNLGVEIDRSQTGMQRLKALSDALNRSNDQTAARIKELTGGVFQMNIVTAALRDLSKEYGIYTSALSVANDATTEAEMRNMELNKSLSAMANAASVNFVKLSSAAGSLAFEPALRRALEMFNNMSDYMDNNSMGKIGAKTAEAVLAGIGNVLGGPGMLLIASALGKLTANMAKFTINAASQFGGVNNDRQIQIQTAIQNVLQSQNRSYAEQISKATSLAQQEQIILQAIRQQSVEKERQLALTANLGAYMAAQRTPLGRSVYSAGQGEFAKPRKSFARGYIPSQAEVEMERRSANYTAGRVVALEDFSYDPSLSQRQQSQNFRQIKQNFGKGVIANTAETIVSYPNGEQGIFNPVQMNQIDPRSMEKAGFSFSRIKANGFVPNFGLSEFNKFQMPLLARHAKLLGYSSLDEFVLNAKPEHKGKYASFAKLIRAKHGARFGVPTASRGYVPNFALSAKEMNEYDSFMKHTLTANSKMLLGMNRAAKFQTPPAFLANSIDPSLLFSGSNARDLQAMLGRQAVSKGADAQVAYHGTKAFGKFDEFLQNTHVGTREQAETRLTGLLGKMPERKRLSVFSAYKKQGSYDSSSDEMVNRPSYLWNFERRKKFLGADYSNEFEGSGLSTVLFEPNYLKNASLASVDKEGNYIPLSDRFNFQSKNFFRSQGYVPNFASYHPEFVKAFRMYNNLRKQSKKGNPYFAEALGMRQEELPVLTDTLGVRMKGMLQTAMNYKHGAFLGRGINKFNEKYNYDLQKYAGYKDFSQLNASSAPENRSKWFDGGIWADNARESTSMKMPGEVALQYFDNASPELRKSILRELGFAKKAFGYVPEIGVGKDHRLVSNHNPSGLGVFSPAYGQQNLSQAIQQHKSLGEDPRFSGGGFIPNFAKSSLQNPNFIRKSDLTKGSVDPKLLAQAMGVSEGEAQNMIQYAFLSKHDKKFSTPIQNTIFKAVKKYNAALPNVANPPSAKEIRYTSRNEILPPEGFKKRIPNFTAPSTPTLTIGDALGYSLKGGLIDEQGGPSLQAVAKDIVKTGLFQKEELQTDEGFDIKKVVQARDKIQQLINQSLQNQEKASRVQGVLESVNQALSPQSVTARKAFTRRTLSEDQKRAVFDTNFIKELQTGSAAYLTQVEPETAFGILRGEATGVTDENVIQAVRNAGQRASGQVGQVQQSLSDMLKKSRREKLSELEGGMREKYSSIAQRFGGGAIRDPKILDQIKQETTKSLETSGVTSKNANRYANILMGKVQKDQQVIVDTIDEDLRKTQRENFLKETVKQVQVKMERGSILTSSRDPLKIRPTFSKVERDAMKEELFRANLQKQGLGEMDTQTAMSAAEGMRKGIIPQNLSAQQRQSLAIAQTDTRQELALGLRQGRGIDQETRQNVIRQEVIASQGSLSTKGNIYGFLGLGGGKEEMQQAEIFRQNLINKGLSEKQAREQSSMFLKDWRQGQGASLRRQAFQQQAFTSSFAIPFVGGAIANMFPDSQFAQGIGKGSQTVGIGNYLSTLVPQKLGVPVLAVSAIAGLSQVISETTNPFKKLSKEFNNLKGAQEQLIQGIGEFVNASSNLEQGILTGTTEATKARLQRVYEQSFANVIAQAQNVSPDAVKKLQAAKTQRERMDVTTDLSLEAGLNQRRNTANEIAAGIGDSSWNARSLILGRLSDAALGTYMRRMTVGQENQMRASLTPSMISRYTKDDDINKNLERADRDVRFLDEAYRIVGQSSHGAGSKVSEGLSGITGLDSRVIENLTREQLMQTISLAKETSKKMKEILPEAKKAKEEEIAKTESLAMQRTLGERTIIEQKSVIDLQRTLSEFAQNFRSGQLNALVSIGGSSLSSKERAETEKKIALIGIENELKSKLAEIEKRRIETLEKYQMDLAESPDSDNLLSRQRDTALLELQAQQDLEEKRTDLKKLELKSQQNIVRLQQEMESRTRMEAMAGGLSGGSGLIGNLSGYQEARRTIGERQRLGGKTMSEIIEGRRIDEDLAIARSGMPIFKTSATMRGERLFEAERTKEIFDRQLKQKSAADVSSVSDSFNSLIQQSAIIPYLRENKDEKGIQDIQDQSFVLSRAKIEEQIKAFRATDDPGSLKIAETLEQNIDKIATSQALSLTNDLQTSIVNALKDQDIASKIDGVTSAFNALTTSISTVLNKDSENANKPTFTEGEKVPAYGGINATRTAIGNVFSSITVNQKRQRKTLPSLYPTVDDIPPDPVEITSVSPVSAETSPVSQLKEAIELYDRQIKTIAVSVERDNEKLQDSSNFNRDVERFVGRNKNRSANLGIASNASPSLPTIDNRVTSLSDFGRFSDFRSQMQNIDLTNQKALPELAKNFADMKRESENFLSVSKQSLEQYGKLSNEMDKANAQLQLRIALLSKASTEEIRSRAYDSAMAKGRNGDFFQGAGDILQAQFGSNPNDTSDVLKTLNDGIGSSKEAFKGFFREIIDGTQSIGDTARNALRNLANDLAKKASDNLTERGTSGLFSIFQKLMPQMGGGSPAQGFNSGGKVFGKSGIDKVPAYLSEGEFVIRKPAVDAYGDQLFNMANDLSLPKFNNGGFAGDQYKGRDKYELMSMLIGGGAGIGMAHLLSSKKNKKPKWWHYLLGAGLGVGAGMFANQLFGKEQEKKDKGFLGFNSGGYVSWDKSNEVRQAGRTLNPELLIQSGLSVEALEDPVFQREFEIEKDYQERLKAWREAQAELLKQHNAEKKNRFFGTLIGGAMNVAFAGIGGMMKGGGGIPTGGAIGNDGIPFAQAMGSNGQTIPLFESLRGFSGKGFNSGGYAIDSIPAWLTAGEVVINKQAVSKYGVKQFEDFNNMRVPRFNNGGVVGTSPQFTPSPFDASSSSSQGQTNNINISIQIDSNGNVTTSQEDQNNSQSNQYEEAQQMAKMIEMKCIEVMQKYNRPHGKMGQ